MLLLAARERGKEIERACVLGYFDIWVAKAICSALLEGSERLEMCGGWPWLAGSSQLCVHWCCWEVSSLGPPAFVPPAVVRGKKSRLDHHGYFCRKWRLFCFDEERLDTRVMEEKARK